MANSERSTLRNAGSLVMSGGSSDTGGEKNVLRPSEVSVQSDLLHALRLGHGDMEQLCPKSPPGRPGRGTIKYTGPLGRIRLPGSHWTENPMALEMMKAMSFSYTVPSLQPRLTKFHGTRVPVLILFFLFSTEVGRLAALDTFWKRIVQHAMAWQGLYCRDYGAKRCVWQTLHGKAGSKMCLFHLGTTYPAEFVEICKQITAIPGRSDEELMHSYCNWRLEQKALFAALDRRQTAELNGPIEESGLEQMSASSHQLPDVPDTSSQNQLHPWLVRAHCSYGLGINHSCIQPHSSQLQTLRPVLRAAAWSRDSPVGRPPKQTRKKIGSVPPTWAPATTKTK